MTKQQFSTIDRDDLEQRIAAHSLNNQDRHRGFALVNVLGEGAFAMAHIPGAINAILAVRKHVAAAPNPAEKWRRMANILRARFGNRSAVEPRSQGPSAGPCFV
ncbi:MAG: hypothetical protein ACREYF_16745 [Gammaproteobacteria bacterium]